MNSLNNSASRRGSLKRKGIFAIVFALIASAFAFASMSPANATGTTTGSDCTYEWVREIPQSHTEAKYKKSVTDYKADPQWQKQVRGNIQKLSGGSWVNTGTAFGFEDWERPTWNTDGSFYWESEYDGRSLSGTHGATSVSYSSGGYTYRKAATHFQYAKNGVTRQIVSGSHYEYYLTGGGSSLTNTDANWTRETPGSPWVKFDTRTVQDPSIKQGPVRSATEPDRGQYPNVPWTQVPGSGICKVQVPVVPVNDECGPGNAVYGTVPAGPWTSVINPNGSLTLTANAGTTFPNGPSFTYPVPVDSNVPCPVPPIPPVPPVPPTPPTPEPEAVNPAWKKVDKCEGSNFLFITKKKGYHVMNRVTGNLMPEGRWLKVNGNVAKIKFVAREGFRLVGNAKVTVKFPNNASCSPPVVVLPPSGV